MLDFIIHFDQGLGGISVAGFLLFIFLATFVSEDGACILAGTEVANGRIGLPAALAACFAGILVGDLLLFGAGRVAGRRVFENPLVRKFIPTRNVQRASEWLENNAGSAVFFSRFVTGFRLPTYLAAGALRTDFLRFAFWFAVASIVWTPLLVGSVVFAQATIFSTNALLGVILLFVLIRLGFKFTSWKYRRSWVGRIKRITNWEFWPIQIFYLPVVVYILLLAFKYRRLTIFACANPALPAGGFKGESKNEIFKALGKSGRFKENILAHTLIPGDDELIDRIDAARQFMDENRLFFPLVIKPDAGERGNGVRIIHSLDEMTETLTSIDHAVIVQEFAPGEEVSIFYYRFPRDSRGQIFSITEKHFPTVKGNGVSTLEELILEDPRAVAMARKYFEHNKHQIDRVPGVDETIRLIDTGTHSRGAIFLEGFRLKTRALEAKINEICHGFDGFYFGRFDIRVPTYEDLRLGQNLKIIELNGVTSESTNIYDPDYSLFDAYRILFRQWRLAFEIGAENSKLGASETSVISLLRLGIGLDKQKALIIKPDNSALA